MISTITKRRRIIDICIYLIIVVILLALVVVISRTEWLSLSVQQGNHSEVVENVQMRIISPNWNIEYSVVITENVTVADFLIECADHNDFTIQKKYWTGYKSFLIEAINDIENGDDDRYWQYYVNDKFADVGCSNYFLDDNDVVEWRFEQSNWMS